MKNEREDSDLPLPSASESGEGARMDTRIYCCGWVEEVGVKGDRDEGLGVSVGLKVDDVVRRLSRTSAEWTRIKQLISGLRMYKVYAIEAGLSAILHPQ